jgi:hypothetical protein
VKLDEHFSHAHPDIDLLLIAFFKRSFDFLVKKVDGLIAMFALNVARNRKSFSVVHQTLPSRDTQSPPARSEFVEQANASHILLRPWIRS